MTLNGKMILPCVLCGVVAIFVLLWFFNMELHVYHRVSKLKGINGKKYPQPSRANENLVNITHGMLEKIRREVASGIRTTAVFLRYNLQNLSMTVNASATETTDALLAEVDALLAEAEDRLRVIQLDLTNLDSFGDLTAWREREADILSQEVQRRIDVLQNPKDCTTAKKILCRMSRNAGAGSLIHHLVYCIMAAYGSGKTFILQSQNWRYSKKGWEVLFQPLSRTCVDVYSGIIDHWPGTNESEAVMFPDWDMPRPKPNHQPQAVPQDIANRLQSFHEMPAAWWVGQFIAYMMRLQPEMQQIIDEVKIQLNYSHPIVGVHIRRTDKEGETKLFPIEEYMIHVENYYLGHDLKSSSAVPVHRRVFLASEQTSIITEARKKYPNYEFLWHENNAQKQENRYNIAGLMDLVTDLYFLAHSDYLVCTFSSNVCRLGYEMMLSLHADAPSRIISLDTNYFFYFERTRHLKVRFPHHPDRSAKEKGYMQTDAGQVLTAVRRNVALTGYIKVMDPSSKRPIKLIPDYKMCEILDVVNVTVSYGNKDRAEA